MASSKVGDTGAHFAGRSSGWRSAGETLWSKYRVVTVRNRVRLQHHELVAQLLGVLLDGVTDGGQPKIDKLYQRYDTELPEDCEEKFEQVCTFVVENFSDVSARS